MAQKLFDLTDYISQDNGGMQFYYHTNYQWCMWDGGEHNNWCFTFDWTILIGWTAHQYSDDFRNYNLTLTPFAYASLNTKSLWNAAPFSLSVEPYFALIDWKFPWSFEMVRDNLFCFDWYGIMEPMHH